MRAKPKFRLRRGSWKSEVCRLPHQVRMGHNRQLSPLNLHIAVLYAKYSNEVLYLLHSTTVTLSVMILIWIVVIMALQYLQNYCRCVFQVSMLWKRQIQISYFASLILLFIINTLGNLLVSDFDSKFFVYSLGAIRLYFAIESSQVYHRFYVSHYGPMCCYFDCSPTQQRLFNFIFLFFSHFIIISRKSSFRLLIVETLGNTF